MFVESAVNRDIKTFTEKADEIIASRIDGIVAEMRKVIGSKLFSEEVVNELSKETLGSYINKASKEKRSILDKGSKSTNKERNTYNKRAIGINIAKNKADNIPMQLGRLKDYKEETVDEDEEVNELSKKTLGSYVTKASRDVLAKSAAGGVGIGGSNYKKKLDGTKMLNKAGRRTNSIATAANKLAKEDLDEDEVNEAAPPRETPETSTVHIDTAISRAKDKHPELHKKLTNMKGKGAQWVVSHPTEGMKFYGGRKK